MSLKWEVSVNTLTKAEFVIYLAQVLVESLKWEEAFVEPSLPLALDFDCVSGCLMLTLSAFWGMAADPDIGTCTIEVLQMGGAFFQSSDKG